MLTSGLAAPIDKPPPATAGWQPLLALALALALLAGWNTQREFARQNEQEGQRLQAQAVVYAAQVEHWLAQHLSLASFITSGTRAAEIMARWQVQKDPADLATLQSRAAAFRRELDGDGVLFFDGQGQLMAPDPGGADDGGAPLRAAVLAAVASGKPAHTGLYRREGGAAPVRIDFVVPMVRPGLPAAGAIAVRVDARRMLLPLLAPWPGASRTGEVVLWQLEGDRLVLYSDVRRPPGQAEPISEALATSTLPPARLLRGEIQPGEQVRAPDYRGVPVLATVQGVSGSNWWLVAQIDREEVVAPAWRSAGWSAALALLTWAASALALRLWLHRRALVQLQHDRRQQRQQVQTLALLRALAESSSDAIFAKDLQGRYQLYNRAACEEIGRELDEVLGHTDSELFGAADSAPLVANDRLALAASSPQRFEEHIHTPGGVLIKLCTKGALRGDEGQLIGVFGISRDVTQARLAERARQDSDAQYRAVVAVLSEGIMVVDAQGRMLTCNPAAERMTGTTEAVWKGQGVVAPGWQALRPDGSTMAPEETPPGLVLAGAGPQRGVLMKTRSPQGALAWFELSAVPVFSGDGGALIAVVTSFHDVTRRTQQEAELARHRERLQDLVTERTQQLQDTYRAMEEAARFNRAITDKLPARVTYWDTELRCRFANQTHLSWHGKTSEQVLFHTMAETLALDYHEQVRPRALAALQGEAQTFERVSPTSTGPVVHQLVYIPDRDDSGAVRGIFCMAFDITALKQAQAELTAANAELAQARDVAEAATRAKSAFLANMSHEIRTPMNAIIGMAHLMLRDKQSALDRERLGKINDAAQHLLQVINDILDLSKIEAGKLVLDDTEFAVGDVMTRAFEMVALRAQAKGLQLKMDLDSLPARLRGDPTRLAQALINLLANAVKFTERGGVRLGAKVVREEPHRLLLHFEVTDTGEGIDPERQAQLFLPFEQADGSMTRRHGGTGLGLALTRHFSLLMGGEVGLHSTPGSGSTFWFTAWLGRASPHGPAMALPEPPPLRAPTDAEMQLRQRHAGQRVLLVEDNAVNQEVAEQILRVVGLDVETANDGQQALERATTQHYDLILMDMQMPVMDGLEATRRIRARQGGATPIVAMTANAFAEDRQACLAAGMNDHVAKPIAAPLLYATLLRWLPLPEQPAPAPATPQRREEADASALLQRLAQVPGFDAEIALRSLGGKLPALQRVLERLVQTYSDGSPALAAPPGDGEMAAWASACHSLRGACASVGATALQQALTRLEAQARSGADLPAVRERALRLNAEMQQLVAALEAALHG